MKSFFIKVIFILLIAAGGYIFITSYRPVPEGMISVVYGNQDDAPVIVVPAGSRFVIQGVAPWLYHIETIALDKRDSFDVKMTIPSLVGLKDEYYGISIPVSVEYSIEWDKVRDYTLFRNNSLKISNIIFEDTVRFFSNQLQPYLLPFYRGPALEFRKEEIKAAVRNGLTDKLAGQGITLKRIDIYENWTYPDNERYREGLQYLAELRRIEIENAKSLSLLKNRLEGEKIQEEALYKKYREMSRIIKQNPDILKYIYIDKLTDDLKVIVSSDKSMVPLFLEEGKNKGSVSEKGEINNLR